MSYKPPKTPKLRSILKKVATVARDVAEVETLAFASAARRSFVGRIQDQDFPSFRVVFYPESGTNLSPRWLARKEAKGADPRTMIATGHYVSQIRLFRRTTKAGVTFRVGFHPRARARDLDGNTQKATLNLVARVLEHGSQKMRIPPRPHWEPHSKLLAKQAVAARVRIAKKVVKAIRREIGGS